MMKRIFIALKVHPGQNFKNILKNLKDSFKDENIKWVDPENIHITIVFIGNTEEEKIETISSLLTERCTGLGEFGIVLRGIGVFKNFRDPRIIWAGTEPSESLFRLNDVIVSGLKYKGINTEERSFNPHLTLGRIKMIRPQKNLKLILDKYMDLEIQKVSVSEVILYESILTTQGPLYRPIRIINLT